MVAKRKTGGDGDVAEALRRIEKRQLALVARLDRVLQGMDWMMDPEPEELPDAPRFPPLPDGVDLPKRARSSGKGGDQRLIDKRTNPYRAGQQAHRDGVHRMLNPYPNNTGGNQRAWWLGYDDDAEGLDRSSGPAS